MSKRNPREIRVEQVPIKGGISTELIARAIAKTILKELKKDGKPEVR